MVEMTGHERVMDVNEIIVSKTNLKGHLTYANDVFCKFAGYSVSEIMGKPHSIIRNPNMPRCVFKLLWDRIQDGKEIFAYVVNRSRNGDHYWVLAHVTPSYDPSGQINGYHSNRRKPDSKAVATISEIYDLLLKEEAKHSNRKDGMNAGTELLHKFLEDKGVEYDEFVLSI